MELEVGQLSLRYYATPQNYLTKYRRVADTHQARQRRAIDEQGIIGSMGIGGQRPKFYDKDVRSKNKNKKYAEATDIPDRNNLRLPDKSSETTPIPY